ncbi:glycosyltransferase [Methylophilaceae bacterium]|nr:glycosyltransferase [Methylophilaceae bacterium]
MKILHIATQDISGGGGSFNASYRLHQGMKSFGIDSKLLVLNKLSNDTNVLSPRVSPYLPNKVLYFIFKAKHFINTKFFNRSPYFYTDSKLKFSARKILNEISFMPDVIIAHWISGFINTNHLYDLNKNSKAPILWYFLDNAPFTGGCHYFSDCKGYENKCGNCPQLGKKRDNNDISKIQFRNKSLALTKTNITALTASSWQLEKINKSTIFKNKRSELIHLGIDTKIFCPDNRDISRQNLNLPVDTRIIFFGAISISERRKGFDELTKALKILDEMIKKHNFNQNILILIASKKKQPKFNVNFNYKNIGYLKTEEELASVYKASDIFVCPSIEDAGPMMINESITCGTPVVSFNMGIAKDLVINDFTGYRAKLGDSRDLANGIFRLLTFNKRKINNMRKNCRNLGLKYCDQDIQVKSFFNLCNLLTKSKH